MDPLHKSFEALQLVRQRAQNSDTSCEMSERAEARLVAVPLGRLSPILETCCDWKCRITCRPTTLGPEVRDILAWRQTSLQNRSPKAGGVSASLFQAEIHPRPCCSTWPSFALAAWTRRDPRAAWLMCWWSAGQLPIRAGSTCSSPILKKWTGM